MKDVLKLTFLSMVYEIKKIDDYIDQWNLMRSLIYPIISYSSEKEKEEVKNFVIKALDDNLEDGELLESSKKFVNEL